MVDLLVILGSATPPGRLHRAVLEATQRIGDNVHAELLDLAEVRIAAADGRPPSAYGDDTERVVSAIADAGAVLLATPVYRGSLTGILKNLLDHVPVSALQGKPVGIVAMGATDHHFLGAERHLRDILAFFGALTAPVAVYLTSADFEEGRPGARACAAVDDLLVALLRLQRAVPRDVADRPAPLAARDS